MESNTGGKLRVLVVEDEYLVAAEIASILEDAGHSVLGPVGSVNTATALLRDEAKPDIAIIDVNLRGQSAAPIAECMSELGVPFCVCTGYRSSDLRASFGDDVATVQKPVTPAGILHAIDQIIRNMT